MKSSGHLLHLLSRRTPVRPGRSTGSSSGLARHPGWALLMLLMLLVPGRSTGRASNIPRCEHQHPLPTGARWKQPAPASSSPSQSARGAGSSSPDSRPPSAEKQAVFEQVFGRPRPRTERVIVPLVVNDAPAGQVTVRLSQPDGRVMGFQAAPLLARAVELMRPELFQALEAAVDAQGNLTLEAVQATKLEATFQKSRLELWVTIPPDTFQVQAHDLLTRGLPPGAKDAIPPSRLSGFLNLRAGEGFGWYGSSGTGLQRLPLGGELEGALYLNGWVLESRAVYAEGGTSPWAREDSRVVHDDAVRALRFIAGDFAFPTMGTQVSQPLLGLSIARHFGLQPYKVIQPISQYAFFLERPSRVEVFTNGRLVRTLSLQAGPQDIRNLSLDAGTNHVQLIITDDLGRRQVIDFTAAVSGSLLAPGLHQFAYGVGLAPLDSIGLGNYHWRRPTLSMVHRSGLTNAMTVGGYLHANIDHQSAGSELVWATRLGNFKGDLAVSHTLSPRIGTAAMLQYEWLGAQRRLTPSINLAVNWQDEHYLPLGSIRATTFTPLEASCQLSQPLPAELRGTLAARAEWGDAGSMRPRAHSASISLGRQFRPGPTVDLTLTHQRLTTGVRDWRAFLSLSWPLVEHDQSVDASAGIDRAGDISSQLAWGYHSPRSVGGTNASATLSHSPGEEQLSTQLAYNGYRALIDASDLLTWSDEASSPLSNVTRLSAGTAVVFADGRLAWSRPGSPGPGR